MHKSDYYYGFCLSLWYLQNFPIMNNGYSEFSDIGNLFRIRLVNTILKIKRIKRIYCRVCLVYINCLDRIGSNEFLLRRTKCTEALEWLVSVPVKRNRWFMVFYATFNNSSVISWRSVLLVEETGVRGENHRLATSP